MKKRADDPTVLIRQVLDDEREIVHVRSKNMAGRRRAPRTGQSLTIERFFEQRARDGRPARRQAERIRLTD